MILRTLKKTGYKITDTRKAIAKWIERRGKIFSAGELLSDMPDLDKVSLYRTLELLTELDLIHPVMTLHGQQHYELHGENHHHHVVCESCEETACLPCPVENIRKPKQFDSIHHNVSFTGLCNACL